MKQMLERINFIENHVKPLVETYEFTNDLQGLITTYVKSNPGLTEYNITNIFNEYFKDKLVFNMPISFSRAIIKLHPGKTIDPDPKRTVRGNCSVKPTSMFMSNGKTGIVFALTINMIDNMFYFDTTFNHELLHFEQMVKESCQKYIAFSNKKLKKPRPTNPNPTVKQYQEKPAEIGAESYSIAKTLQREYSERFDFNGKAYKDRGISVEQFLNIPTIQEYLMVLMRGFFDDTKKVYPKVMKHIYNFMLDFNR